jgi:Ala-tRNA(Pro) deacylase
MWLVTCDENQSVDLRHLGTALGAGRLSFASPERLMRFLGITTGAVSPLALINDVTHKVHFAIDRSLLRHDQLHVHPLVNTLTTTLPTIGLVQFAIKTGHPPGYLTFNHDGSVTVDTSSNKMPDGRLKVT